MSEGGAKGDDRRTFLGRASSGAMALGMVAGYGTLGVMAGQFLYPSRSQRRAWLFVTEVERMRIGDVLAFVSPSGERISVTRRAKGGADDDFLALSSTCPHLGCQVHWEAANDRFFCPCHNGAFDSEGKATAGPPAEANQSLPRYPLRIENGLLMIEVPVDTLGA